jgi:hypothetical protein
MKELEYSSKKTSWPCGLCIHHLGQPVFGVQYMSIYVRSFSFTNAFTVGLIISLGYLITTAAQLVWGTSPTTRRPKSNSENRDRRRGLNSRLIILPKHASYFTLVPSVSLVFVFLMIPGC